MANNILEQMMVKYAAVNVSSTFSYSNKTDFFNMCNPTFKDYYNIVLRRSLQWLDNYVPDLHNSQDGIFATHLAPTIVNGITNQIIGKGISFKRGNATTDDKDLDFISHKWADQVNFKKAVKQAIGYATGLGTSALILNKTASGTYWIRASRCDNFFFTETEFGELREFVSYVRNYSSTIQKGNNYFLVERRYFKPEQIEGEVNGKKVMISHLTNEVPYRVMEVYEYNGTSITYNNMASAINSKGLKWEKLPKDVQKEIQKDFNGIFVGKEEVLPFPMNDLGVQLLKFEQGDVSIPNVPFGKSILWEIQSELIEYDCAFSYAFRDMYNGKGVVGVPRSLSMGDMGISGVGDYPATSDSSLAQRFEVNPVAGSNNAFSQMNIPGYELLPGVDPQEQKPIITQFDLRVAEWEAKQDSILRRIATKLGMSPKVIASYLGKNLQQKTATEVDSEDDSIIAWVDSHRMDFETPINRIIETVLNCYGRVGNVEIRFSTSSFMSKSALLKEVETEYKDGFIDLKEAITRLNPDADEQQLNDLVTRAIEQQKINESKQKALFDDGGDILEDDSEDSIEEINEEQYEQLAN